ncbi:hypothetical protein Dsin_027268 [Dipteronia sinensis]|uniref:F-box associated beta-propeller type 3 domain-containing protein n=1 Tax=Dipteronia sinensis TaxID=43782 RepID=A0AAE0DUF2_9ROSI|nr:hypothetical protein Dsin_027268 [Dipteronia sinensis]
MTILDLGSQSGNFVNGALYWLIHYVVWLGLGNFHIPDDYISLVLLRFDLSNQEFSVILPPEEVASVQTFIKDDSVGVFGGRLSMVGYNRENHHMCMWAMEDQNQNWIKLMSIPPLVETETYIFLIPVCLMNNGELLLTIGYRSFIDRLRRRYNGEFFLYNPEEKTFKELEIQDIEYFSGHTTYTRDSSFTTY